MAHWTLHDPEEEPVDANRLLLVWSYWFGGFFVGLGLFFSFFRISEVLVFPSLLLHWLYDTRIKTEWNQSVFLAYMSNASYNGMCYALFLKAGRLSASFTFGNRMFCSIFGTKLGFWNSSVNFVLFLAYVLLLDLNWGIT